MMGRYQKKTSHQQRSFVIQALFEKQIEGNFTICIFWGKPWKKITQKFCSESKIQLLEVVWTIVLLEL